MWKRADRFAGAPVLVVAWVLALWESGSAPILGLHRVLDTLPALDSGYRIPCLRRIADTGYLACAG